VGGDEKCMEREIVEFLVLISADKGYVHNTMDFASLSSLMILCHRHSPTYTMSSSCSIKVQYQVALLCFSSRKERTQCPYLMGMSCTKVESQDEFHLHLAPRRFSQGCSSRRALDGNSAKPPKFLSALL
jgi:hypothetical protein